MLRIKSNKAIGIIPLIITVVVLMLITGVAITALPSKDIFKFAGMKNDLIEEEEAQKNTLKQEYINSIENKINVTHEELTLGDATVNVKVDTLSTINGEMYGAANPVIPVGFKPINVEETQLTRATNWDAEDIAEEVKKGLVISDGTSEFVWIPVANINNMVMCMTHGASVTLDQTTLQCPICGENTKLAGKLYSTTTGENFDSLLIGQTYTSNTGLREPDVVTGVEEGTDSTTGTKYDATTNKLSIVLEGEYANTKTAESFKSQLEEEFTKMAQSVAKYKGFYVGRYETSLSGTITQSKSEEVPMNNIDWYTMYKNSKTYSRNNTSLGVVSEMIWGCQWDQMIKLILTGPDENHTVSKTNVGHSSKDFSIAPYETGGTNYEEVYNGETNQGKYGDISSNIYDLEGNVYEWTKEAFGFDVRSRRGGFYVSALSPSYRHSGSPSGVSSYAGSRMSLYIEIAE